MAWPCVARACCLARFWTRHMEREDLAVPLVTPKYAGLFDEPQRVETQEVTGLEASESVTRRDYRPWKAKRPEPNCKPRCEFQLSSQPFATESQYMTDYRPWPLPSRELTAPPNSRTRTGRRCVESRCSVLDSGPTDRSLEMTSYREQFCQKVEAPTTVKAAKLHPVFRSSFDKLAAESAASVPRRPTTRSSVSASRAEPVNQKALGDEGNVRRRVRSTSARRREPGSLTGVADGKRRSAPGKVGERKEMGRTRMSGSGSRRLNETPRKKEVDKFDKKIPTPSRHKPKTQDGTKVTQPPSRPIAEPAGPGPHLPEPLKLATGVIPSSPQARKLESPSNKLLEARE
uniref:microtubule-associated protein 6-like n=1 Tax=Myxine glutinosa TaxID=7769 RepID=UPI00358F15DC